MEQEIKQALAHVLWIGGAPDTGKTTISQIAGARYGLQLYSYDEQDLAQVKRLAEHVRAEAQRRGLTVVEVDGSRSAEEMAALIERHFEPYFRD